MSGILHDLKDLRIQVIHPPDAAGITLFEHLVRIGCNCVTTWPLPDAYDRIVAECERKGIRVGQSGESNRGPFAYFETDVFPGTCMEIAAMTDLRRRQFEGIAKAAVNWDGSDPIRTRWPE